MRNIDSDTMYHSGKLDARVTRRHAVERQADMVAIVSRMVPQRKPLKGSRKLSQFVKIPGFLMKTADLGKQSVCYNNRMK
jgi:hypothetical protein